VWKGLSKLFLSPDGTSGSVRDPRERAVVFPTQQSASIQVHLSVPFFVESYVRRNSDIRMCNRSLCCLGPLNQTAARKTIVWLDYKRFDISVARLVGFALLHQRRCRIAV